MEFGFGEGFEINDWIHQKGEESKLSNLLEHFPYPKEIHDTFKWLRKYNSENNNSVNFTGIDIPRNGGSLFPSIEIIKDFIEKADKDALPLVLEIYETAKKTNGLSTAQSVFLLNKISTEEQYKLTALYQIYKQKLQITEFIERKNIKALMSLVNGTIDVKRK